MTREELRANRQKYIELAESGLDNRIKEEEVIILALEVMKKKAAAGELFDDAKEWSIGWQLGFKSDRAEETNAYREAKLINVANSFLYDIDTMRAELDKLSAHADEWWNIVTIGDDGGVYEGQSRLYFRDGHFEGRIGFFAPEKRNLVTKIYNEETGEVLFDIRNLPQIERTAQSEHRLEVAISEIDSRIDYRNRQIKDLNNTKELIPDRIDRFIEVAEKCLYEGRFEEWMKIATDKDKVINDKLVGEVLLSTGEIMERLADGEIIHSGMYPLGVNKDVVLKYSKRGPEYMRAKYAEMNFESVAEVEREVRAIEKENAQFAAQEAGKYADMRDVELKTIDPENIKDLANVGDGKGE